MNLGKMFVGIMIGLSLFSCTEEDDINTSEKSVLNVQNKDVEVIDGYLKFSNDSVFKNYLLSVQNYEDGLPSTRAVAKNLHQLELSGFKSIATLYKELENVNTRSSTESMNDNMGINPDAECVSNDDEEMTLDEYHAMQADELLKDPSLEVVMDTTLRIQISDKLYKITHYGTFSAPKNQEIALYSAIAEFDTTLISKLEDGQSIQLTNDVVFTNSFGDKMIQNQTIKSYARPITRSIESINGVNLQQGYNTVDYKWKNHSIWQKFWDKARGKDVNREVNFDSKHRIQVEVFNVNYLFYASAGLKVKMQKRKKFCFVKYWVNDNADNIAVGFNCLTGTLTFNNPANYSSFCPSQSAAWNSFKSTLNNQMRDFIYSSVQASNLPIVRSWCNTKDRILLCIPKMSPL